MKHILFLTLVTPMAHLLPLQAMQQLKQTNLATRQTTHNDLDQKTIQEYATLLNQFYFNRTHRPHLFELLAEHPSLINEPVGSFKATTLMMAMHPAWSAEEFEKFLNITDLNIDAQNELGETALIKAADLSIDNGSPQASAKLILLLAHKADVSIKDRLGRTALHAAAKKQTYGFNTLSQEEIEAGINNVNQLLQAGADINAQDNNGLTPVMLAAEQRFPEMVSHLLASGAKTDIVIQEGKYTGKTLYNFANGSPSIEQAIKNGLAAYEETAKAAADTHIEQTSGFSSCTIL